MATTCPSYNVRAATRSDIPTVKMLIDMEGWDYDINFLYCMYDLDSRAWFVAEADTGDIIGVRALTYFDETITAGGFYIVKKPFRGYGIGRAVNAAALDSVGNSNIIISATDVNLYNTRGFILVYDIHHKRVKVGAVLKALPFGHTKRDVTIKPFTDAMLTDVIKYDAHICKHDRPGFVLKWNIQTSTLVLIACTEPGVAGYGCLHLNEYGYQIAPLYADSDTIAWSLMKGLLEMIDVNTDVDLFISSENEKIQNLFQVLPHENIVTLHKMYRGMLVEMKMKNVYSLSCMAMAAL